MTTAIHNMATASKIQRENWVKAIQAKKIYTLLKIPMKSRSPGVVGIGRKPRRSKEGATVCHTVMAITVKIMAPQKIPVGTVHSIHSRVNSMILPPYTRPMAKPLAI